MMSDDTSSCTPPAKEDTDTISEAAIRDIVRRDVSAEALRSDPSSIVEYRGFSLELAPFEPSLEKQSASFGIIPWGVYSSVLHGIRSGTKVVSGKLVQALEFVPDNIAKGLLLCLQAWPPPPPPPRLENERLVVGVVFCDVRSHRE